MADIRFQCDACGQPLVVDASASGREVYCPKCHASLIVPAVSLRPARGSTEARPERPTDIPQVEGYQIISKIGKGGMGDVWRAVQLSTGRHVALKLLSHFLFADDAARARFQREIRIAAQLEHPHIARVYHSDQNVFCFAMELIEGIPLDEFITQHKLDTPQILTVMTLVCEAIEYAHQRGVIHTDLKPNNILVTADGQPHVLDFGLAKSRWEDDSGAKVSVSGLVAGTPPYMSPEQASGKRKQLDIRSDVYTLGVILYKLLLGQFPYDVSGSNHEILHNIVHDEPLRPRKIQSSLDSDLEAILMKALAKNPSERYASAGELSTDITWYLNNETVVARRITVTYRLRKWSWRHRVELAVGGTFLAVLLVTGTTLWELYKARSAPPLPVTTNVVIAPPAVTNIVSSIVTQLVTTPTPMTNVAIVPPSVTNVVPNVVTQVVATPPPTTAADADKLKTLAEARLAWTAALADADENLLTKHTPSEFVAAKAKAAAAWAKGRASLLIEATTALKNAIAVANSKENEPKTVAVMARLDTALANQDKFTSEDLLTELEKLIPNDPRVTALRGKVAALPKPKDLVLNLGAKVTMVFVRIRSGSFTMGSDEGMTQEQWEIVMKPAHKVTITKPFYMGKYEVTQEQWEIVMGRNPSSFKGTKNPVDSVSWDDCQTFIRKLGEKVPGYTFRLPTEAEWEYACRSGSTTKYCYGDDADRLGEYAWYTANSGSKTHPVGEKKPNAWGLYDMHGNVWEWCQDGYGRYDSSAATDPVGPSSGSARIVRGQSWANDASICLSASRGGGFPSHPGSRINGLRVVVGVR